MWCSAELPSDHEAACPSCGATLIGEGESLVPGVTAIDTQAIVRSAQTTKTKSRSRLMSWLSGEYEDSDKPAPPGSVSLPTPEVRREMLRLEIEAEVANLNAEVEVDRIGSRRRVVDPDRDPERTVSERPVVGARPRRCASRGRAGRCRPTPPPPEAETTKDDAAS